MLDEEIEEISDQISAEFNTNFGILIYTHKKFLGYWLKNSNKFGTLEARIALVRHFYERNRDQINRFIKEWHGFDPEDRHIEYFIKESLKEN